MKKFLVAIDQGTTSTRSILFDTKGNIKFISQIEFKQYFPKNGWVEHNPNEIWLTTLKTLKRVINKATKLKGQKRAIIVTTLNRDIRKTKIKFPAFDLSCLSTELSIYNIQMKENNRTLWRKRVKIIIDAAYCDRATSLAKYRCEGEKATLTN